MSAHIRLHVGDSMPAHDGTAGQEVQSETHRTNTARIDDLAPSAVGEQERQVKGGRTTVRDSNDKYSNMEISR